MNTTIPMELKKNMMKKKKDTMVRFNNESFEKSLKTFNEFYQKYLYGLNNFYNSSLKTR